MRNLCENNQSKEIDNEGNGEIIEINEAIIGSREETKSE